MGDSELSASQLRNRYHKGGTLADSDLSAKQVRARYAVPSNSSDFSTKHASGGGSNMGMLVGLVVAAILVGGGIYWFMSK